METMKDPTKAGQKPATVKPAKNEAANQNSPALMMNTKIPKVKILIGSVSSIKIGRTKRFKNAKTMAAMMAGYGPASSIPGMYSPTTKSVRAINNSRAISLMHL